MLCADYNFNIVPNLRAGTSARAEWSEWPFEEVSLPTWLLGLVVVAPVIVASSAVVAFQLAAADRRK